MEQNNHNIKQENNNVNVNIENFIFSRYKKPIKTILKNIGDTSYLNAVLFCLGNIRHFAEFFLNPNNQNYINKNVVNYPLSYVFERLIIHFYPYPEKDEVEIYKPDSFLKILGALNMVYKTTKKRNPNDLIIFILDTLHMELNRVKNYNLNLNENKNDKKIVIENAVKKFKSTEDSIIYNTLNWFEIKESKYVDYNKTIYEVRTFTTFSLNIQGSYETIKNKKKFLTLYDCLENYKSPLKINKEIISTSNILCSSNIFIFLLDRGIDFDINKNNLLKIPFELNDRVELENFIEKRNCPKKYQLSGIVSIDIKEQKYVSFCNSPVDKNWYYYKTDEQAKQVDINEVINYHNQYNNLIPCIIIYEKIVEKK